MTTSWDIHELAVLSLDDMLFGVDASQIQEIFRLQQPSFLTTEADKHPFLVLQHQHSRLPIFDLRHYFNLPASLSNRFAHQVLTGITFYNGDCLIACQVSAIKSIVPVSFQSLLPVPHILERLARKMNLWGFYPYSDEIVPLFDLEHIVPEGVLFHDTHHLA